MDQVVGKESMIHMVEERSMIQIVVNYFLYF